MAVCAKNGSRQSVPVKEGANGRDVNIPESLFAFDNTRKLVERAFTARLESKMCDQVENDICR